MRPSLCVAQPLNNLHGRRSKLWLTAGALQEQPCCNGRAHSRKLQRARAPIRGAIELQQQAGSTSAGHATSRSARCNTVDCRVLERPLQSVFDLRQQAGSIRVRQTISSRSVTRLAGGTSAKHTTSAGHVSSPCHPAEVSIACRQRAACSVPGPHYLPPVRQLSSLSHCKAWQTCPTCRTLSLLSRACYAYA